MKHGTIIIIILNLIALVLASSLSFLTWRDAKASIYAHTGIYLAARSKDSVSVWRTTLEESALVRARVEEVFVNHDTLIAFIERLEILAREEKVVLTLSEPEINDRGLAFHLNLIGKLDELRAFFARVENLPYALRIGNLNLAAQNESFWSGSAELLLISFDDLHEAK